MTQSETMALFRFKEGKIIIIKNESWKSTIHTIDPQYFLEDLCYTEVLNHYQTEESDFWLGKHGNDQKVWIGKSDTINLEMAEKRARKMIERGDTGSLRVV